MFHISAYPLLSTYYHSVYRYKRMCLLTRVYGSGYLKRELRDGSPLKQEQQRLLPGNFKFQNGKRKLSSVALLVLWYTYRP